jgi:methylmalonyl-CoA mutase
MNISKQLLEEFDSLSTQEWKAKIEKFLKGKPYESLVNHIEDGMDIQPFYRRADTENLSLPLLKNNDWKIAESFIVNRNYEQINKNILQSLMGSVEIVKLSIEENDPSVLDKVLQDVYLNMIELHISLKSVEGNLVVWINYLSELGKKTETSGSIHLTDFSKEEIHHLIQLLPNWSFCNLELDLSSESTTISSLIAELLLKTVDFFEVMKNSGISPEEAQRRISYTVKINEDYFLSIAVLRALKRLWLAILEAYEIKNPCYPKIHVKTKSLQEDIYQNMISNTTQALAAAIANVYSIEIEDSKTIENSTEFSRRIARNVQNILKMESHIDAVIDPANGSYYIENYSNAIVKKSWESFLLKKVQ